MNLCGDSPLFFMVLQMLPFLWSPESLGTSFLWSPIRPIPPFLWCAECADRSLFYGVKNVNFFMVSDSSDFPLFYGLTKLTMIPFLWTPKTPINLNKT
ncbi:hypothetical protein ES703_106443 [subsurface metagenome]